MSPASWQEAAEALTHEALEAAEKGRWEAVDRYYRARASLFRAHDLPRSLAHRLYPLDCRVHDKLRLVTMSVQQLLIETAAKRRIVERFETKNDTAVERASRISRRV